MATRSWLVLGAGMVVFPPFVSAQDWAQLRTGAASTISFKVAVPLTSLREMTVIEALDKIGSLRVPNVEAAGMLKTSSSSRSPSGLVSHQRRSPQ